MRRRGERKRGGGERGREGEEGRGGEGAGVLSDVVVLHSDTSYFVANLQECFVLFCFLQEF